MPAGRPAAVRADAARYRTGRPCGRGHLAERYTANGNCVACDGERQAARAPGPPGVAPKPMTRYEQKPARSWTTTRKCMACRERFESEGSHNRICGKCKTAERRGGADMGGSFV